MPDKKTDYRLKAGTVFKSVTGTIYSITQFLGAGTQGEVYKVKSRDGNSYVLKYYYPAFANSPNFYEDILELATKTAAPAPAFVWPKEVAEIRDSFGYIMNFIDLSKTKMIFEEDELIERDLACKIGMNIARSMQALHINGMCYKDLSPNNFEYDPQSGEVIIFDCDNIKPKGSKCTISGTLGYRAPEIVLGKSYPDDFSDIFAMATIFFKIWLGSDTAPLEGKRFFEMFDGILDNGALEGESVAEKYIYGTNPLFIFDPIDNSNSLNPNDPNDAGKIALWNYLMPQSLKNLFVDTFTKGLKYPALRPADGRWATCFEQILADIRPCSHCGTKNIASLKYCIQCHELI